MYLVTRNGKFYNVHTSITDTLDEMLGLAHMGIDSMSHSLSFTLFTLTVDDDTYRVLRDAEIAEFVDKAGDTEARALLKAILEKV